MQGRGGRGPAGEAASALRSRGRGGVSGWARLPGCGPRAAGRGEAGGEPAPAVTLHGRLAPCAPSLRLISAPLPPARSAQPLCGVLQERPLAHAGGRAGVGTPRRPAAASASAAGCQLCGRAAGARRCCLRCWLPAVRQGRRRPAMLPPLLTASCAAGPPAPAMLLLLLLLLCQPTAVPASVGGALRHPTCPLLTRRARLPLPTATGPLHRAARVARLAALHLGREPGEREWGAGWCVGIDSCDDC